MTTTLFAAWGAFAPMHSFLRRLVGADTPQRGSSLRTAPHRAAPLVPVTAPCRPRAKVAARTRSTAPLRIVRVVEAGQMAASSSGRMRISGRMADVCAELDRMAEREARLHAGA